MRDDSVLPFPSTPPDAQVLEQFLANECSPEDRARVQAWAGATRSGASVAELVRETLQDTLRQALADTSDPEEYRLALRQRLGRDGVITSATVRPRTRSVPGWTRRAWPGALLVALIGIGVGGFWTIQSHHTPLTLQRTVTTTTGQVAVVRLDDGSEMTLAPRTTVQLLGASGQTRLVRLSDGEAYFNVRDASTTPFVVEAGDVSARVLGTTFSVRRYADDPHVRIAVTSGKVAMTSPAPWRRTMTLVSGDVGDVRDSLASVRADNSAGDETAWLKDKLVFTDAPLVEVLASLSRWYGYEFRYADSSIARAVVTVSLSTRSSAKALATLEQILNVDAAMTGNTVTLTPQRSRGGRAMPRPRTYEVWTPSREVGR